MRFKIRYNYLNNSIQIGIWKDYYDRTFCSKKAAEKFVQFLQRRSHRCTKVKSLQSITDESHLRGNGPIFIVDREESW
jgi:hypothetical protein